MHLLAIELDGFRNLGHIRLGLQPRINFFVGENGQGKTNFLEAVYLLCRGVSFRPTETRSFLQTSCIGKTRIAASFIRRNLEYNVELEIDLSGKSATINQKRVNSASLIANFPVVLFSPESLSSIKEGPEQRRALIDEILISHNPKQGRLLREFSRALRSRNRILRNISDGIGSRPHQLLALESLNKIFFLLATHLTIARISALRDMHRDLQTAMTAIMDSSYADISVDYVISGKSAMEMEEKEVFDTLHNRHRELAHQEFASGTSLVGPHKHDIKLLLAGKDSRFYCSQGQQRALILALKIAQIVYHHKVHQTYPVLLLDDVMSELDAKKRVNLMKFLESISAQILITATDLTWSDHFGQDRNAVFAVTGGMIRQVNS